MGYHLLIEREKVGGIKSLSVLIRSNSDAPAVEFVNRTMQVIHSRFHVEKRHDADIDKLIGISFAKGIVLVIGTGAYLSRLLGCDVIKGRRGLAGSLHIDLVFFHEPQAELNACTLDGKWKLRLRGPTSFYTSHLMPRDGLFYHFLDLSRTMVAVHINNHTYSPWFPP